DQPVAVRDRGENHPRRGRRGGRWGAGDEPARGVGRAEPAAEAPAAVAAEVQRLAGGLRADAAVAEPDPGDEARLGHRRLGGEVLDNVAEVDAEAVVREGVGGD